MSVRGFIRDIISIYLGYEVIRGYVTGSFATTNIYIAALVLFAFSVWFVLERIGVLPKA